MERAEKLIKGLGGEKENWRKKAISFRAESLNVLGDCALCSGIIAYMGAFPISYREATIQAWSKILLEKEIIFSSDF